MLVKTNLLGLAVADAYFLTCILVFVFRLAKRPEISHTIGYFQFLLSLPLIYMLVTAPSLQRPVLYYIQSGLLLLFMVVELLLDYIYKVDFRQTGWMVISYVMLFFAATGGMLGIAAKSGQVGMISAAALFLVMAVLAFVQRAVTGL